MLTYEDWTDRLCKHFFREERAQQPVTFFVDDELLGRLEGSGNVQQGVRSLTTALNFKLGQGPHGGRFNRIDAECTLWKVRGAAGCPPSLPLLAVAVLAATRMARDQGIAINNYWKRFRDLLGLHDNNDLNGINDVLPGLWNQLTWWVDQHHRGNLGLSTISEHPWWTVIGYALSQALFRESDRQYLTDLFQKIGLLPGDDPNAQELLQYFKAWAPGSALSAGAKQMAQDAHYDKRLAAILLDEASEWDGVLRDERGRKMGALVLAYEPAPRPTYTVAAERPPGFAERAIFRSTTRQWQLTPSIEGWYSETWALDPRWLREGLRLESGDFVLAFKSSSVLPLARNRILGCWASVRRVEPGEKYAVLTEARYAAPVEAFLSEHARDEWKREGQAFSPLGWVLFTGVVIEESLPELPPEPLAILAPRVRERPTLRGGLRLDDALGLYLVGGEPDLWLPSLLEPATAVSIDGRPVAVSAGERIALAERRLPAGQHELIVGAAILHFTTTDWLREGISPGNGTLGHRLSRQDGHYVAESVGAMELALELQPGEVAVSGAHLVGASADLPQSQETILLPLEARRYWLIGARPGDIQEPREPARPRWLDKAGDGALYPIGFETKAPFDVAWVVVERHDQSIARLRMRIPPLMITETRSRKINDWCTVFDADPDLDEGDRQLWLEYRAAAALAPRMSSQELAEDRQTEGKQGAHDLSRRRASTPPMAGQALHSLLRLSLKGESSEYHAYESADGLFRIVHWKRDGQWTVMEGFDAKGKRKLLGRYLNEDDALAAVKRVLVEMRTARDRERPR
jgi:hypothetical protein